MRSFSYLFILVCIFFTQASQATPLKLYYKFYDQYVPVGSGSLIGKTGHLLTTAHLISKSRAKEGCNVKEQIKEIEKIGAVFLSPKIVCTNPDTNNPFVDGAILVPIKAFNWEVLDSHIEPVKILDCQNCLDNAYIFGSRSGLKNNIVNYFSNKTLRRGDSGAVVVNNATNEAIAVFYGQGSTIIEQEAYPTSYFFPLDGKEGLLSIIRVFPGQVQVKRAIPAGCKAYDGK